jgi:hypothetical protein
LRERRRFINNNIPSLMRMDPVIRKKWTPSQQINYRQLCSEKHDNLKTLWIIYLRFGPNACPFTFWVTYFLFFEAHKLSFEIWTTVHKRNCKLCLSTPCAVGCMCYLDSGMIVKHRTRKRSGRLSDYLVNSKAEWQGANLLANAKKTFILCDNISERDVSLRASSKRTHF